MSKFTILKFIILFLSLFVLAHGEEEQLSVLSPDGMKVISTKVESKSADQFEMRTKIEIKENGDVDPTVLVYTNFAIIGVKWHSDSGSALVMEHISRQCILRLVSKKDGKWIATEVTQFLNSPNYFSLVNCESVDKSFLCYYSATDEKGSETHYSLLTKLNIATGKSDLLEKNINLQKIGFYSLSIPTGLHRSSKNANENYCVYSPSISDSEPPWYAYAK